MNEAELVDKAIEDGKTKGWATSYLTDPASGKHCLLGMIGYARWGDQWDIDCYAALHLGDGDPDEGLYRRLQDDPLTHQVIQKLADKIVEMDPAYAMPPDRGSFEGSFLNLVVYGWNDDQTRQEDVMQLLEKVRADIG